MSNGVFTIRPTEARRGTARDAVGCGRVPEEDPGNLRPEIPSRALPELILPSLYHPLGNTI